MQVSGDGPRYRGVRQVHAMRGILTAASLSVLLWAGVAFLFHAIL